MPGGQPPEVCESLVQRICSFHLSPFRMIPLFSTLSGACQFRGLYFTPKNKLPSFTEDGKGSGLAL